MGQKPLKKVVLLGTTGSGKTTFLRNLLGVSQEEFDGAEVPRREQLEEIQLEDTFKPANETEYENSTTTISMNVGEFLFYIDRRNNFHHIPYIKGKLPIDKEDLDCLFPIVLIDPAGQERFKFLQEIALTGADCVFIFADGSNIQSIEKVSNYLEMVNKEAEAKNKDIPITVFINKKDLESKGRYIGITPVTRWIDDTEIEISKTTNYNLESFLYPIRNTLLKIPDFPIKKSQFIDSNLLKYST